MINNIQDNIPEIPKPIADINPGLVPDTSNIKKPSLNKLFVLLLLLVTAIVIMFMFYQVQASKQPDSPSNENVSIEVSPTVYEEPFSPITEWRVFTSMLGYSFEYPSEWGEISEEIQDAKSEGTGETGKTYRTTFSSEKAIYIWGSSADYTAGTGCHGWYCYKGSTKNPAKISVEIENNFIGFCYDYYYDAEPYAIGVGYIALNLPDKEINGIVMEFNILSDKDMTKYEKIVNDIIQTESYCKGNQNDGSQIEVSEAAKVKERDLTEMIKNGVDFDEESKIRLDIFNRISNSVKIL
jgi:hypothetical protein